MCPTLAPMGDQVPQSPNLQDPSQLTSHRDHADEAVVRQTKANWGPPLKMCSSVRRECPMLTFWIFLGNEETCPLSRTTLKDAPRRDADADGREQTWKAAWMQAGMFDSYRQQGSRGEPLSHVNVCVCLCGLVCGHTADAGHPGYTGTQNPRVWVCRVYRGLPSPAQK